GGFHHLADLLFHRPVLVALQPADVYDHVELGGPLLDRPLGFEDLGGGRGRAVGETHHRADLHAGAFQLLGAEGDVGRAAAHRLDGVAGRQLTAGPDLVEGELGAEEGVVDGGGELLVGDVGDGQFLHPVSVAFAPTNV